jgi:hypothetical protein
MLTTAHDEGLAPPVGGALVRIHSDDASWIHRLPAVPDGDAVTVTVSTRAQRDVSDDDLARSGYRIVGRQPSSTLPDAVELLVPAATMAAHERWWRQVLTVADRAFDLRLGPVQLVMGSHIGPHLQA